MRGCCSRMMVPLPRTCRRTTRQLVQHPMKAGAYSFTIKCLAGYSCHCSSPQTIIKGSPLAACTHTKQVSRTHPVLEIVRKHDQRPPAQRLAGPPHDWQHQRRQRGRLGLASRPRAAALRPGGTASLLPSGVLLLLRCLPGARLVGCQQLREGADQPLSKHDLQRRGSRWGWSGAGRSI